MQEIAIDTLASVEDVNSLVANLSTEFIRKHGNLFASVFGEHYSIEDARNAVIDLQGLTLAINKRAKLQRS